MEQLEQLLYPGETLWGDYAEFSEMGAQCVGQHHPLTDEQLSRLMQHKHRLLFGQFYPNKSHGRPCDRLADRLGIRRIGLSTLD
ncbi:hypothetical protein GCM10010909_17950 [Acidocella aquatica]|uniref:Transposase n=1 Tax=Acidocella aquatica TaxID=1922313 RepID=A0ABQ6A4M2_9PROT|nr:hypothetical protein GCM10010909_17950 [Acidocella aquatica]